MNLGSILLPVLGIASCAAAPPPAFDGARALRHVATQLEFGPRVAGTVGHSRTAKWLQHMLSGLADEVVVVDFEVPAVEGVQFRNLIARFNVRITPRILLAAHWDSRPRADHDRDSARRSEPIPGANDGASGVAVLLELGRLFHARAPGLGVDIVLFDGEDYGDFGKGLKDVLLGSQHYARTFEGARPRLGILLDMVGDRDLRLLREANSVACCRESVEKVWAVAKELGYAEVFAAGSGPGILDDHVPLNQVGLGVIDLIDFEYPAWHTTADDLSQVSARSLEIVGRVVAEVVYRERP